jgi:hypothetical protein
VDEKVNRSWVLGTAAVGVVLILLAIVADVWWELDNIVPSVLLELGSSALMATVLFLVAPHFTGRIVEAVMDEMRAPAGHRQKRHGGASPQPSADSSPGMSDP